MADSYPLLQYQFHLEIAGVSVAQFTEVSGLSMERDVKAVPQGGMNDHVQMLPGPVKYMDITLKRGLTYSYDLWVWFQQGLYDLKVERKSGSIFQMDKSGQRIRQWDVQEAFPKKYSISDLNAGSGTALIETLVLAHNGLTLNQAVLTALKSAPPVYR